MDAILTKEEVEALLGAPLSDAQTAGFEAWLEAAQLQLTHMLGYPLAKTPVTETRTFYGREYARSLIVHPFTEVTAVRINGTPVDYRIGTSNRPYLYEVVTSRMQGEADEIEVDATWGMGETLPISLRLLLANMFVAVSQGQATSGQAKVKSETVLSHSVTFDTNSSAHDTFTNDNAHLLSMYRLPKPVRVDAGRKIWRGDDDLSGYRPYF